MYMCISKHLTVVLWTMEYNGNAVPGKLLFHQLSNTFCCCSCWKCCGSWWLVWKLRLL